MKKKFKLTREKIYQVFQALLKLKALNTAMWYEVSRNFIALEAFANEYNKQKNDILITLCQKDEKGKPKTRQVEMNGKMVREFILGDNEEKFMEAWGKYTSETIEVSLWQVKYENIKSEIHAPEVMYPLIDVVIIE